MPSFASPGPVVAALALAMALAVSAPAQAQTAQERYESAIERDEKVRALLATGAGAPPADVILQVSRVMTSFESLVRRFPTSGYADNALWQAANLADAAFQREAELFLESQIAEDHSVFDLLTADYTFVNEPLARHYGIKGVSGSHFRRVQLPDDRRAGILGMGAILTVTSYANRTSPVLRGKWLLDTLLGVPPPTKIDTTLRPQIDGKANSRSASSAST